MAKATIEDLKRQNGIKEIERLLDGTGHFTTKLGYDYFVNLLESLNPNAPTSYRLCAAIERDIAGIEMDGKIFPLGRDYEGKEKHRKFYNEKMSNHQQGVEQKDWDLLKAYFAERRDAASDVPPDNGFKNIMKFAERLGLDEDERELLTFVFVTSCIPYMDTILKDVCHKDPSNIPGVACYMLGKPELYEKARKLFSKSGVLAKNDFIQFNETNFLPLIDGDLSAALSAPEAEEADVISTILGKPTTAALDVSDFEHHTKQIKHVCEVIKAAVANGDTGVNILLYGPAGGGKTEMAKAIAEALGLTMYAVGETEPDNPKKGEKNKSTAQKRLAQLHRSHLLLEGNKKAIVMFDEAEDLLIKGNDSTKAADTESKIATNRTAETNPVVTIYIGNDVAQKFHSSLNQRFTYSIYVDYPPAMIRRNIWNRQLQANGVTLPEEDIRMLARKYSPAPRMIAKAANVARLTNGGVKAIEENLRADSQLLAGRSDAIVNHETAGKVYQPSFLDATSLKTVESLIARGRARKPFALIVEGAEGAGVTSTMQYIGEEMVRGVAEVDVADLIAPSPMGPSPEDKIMGVFNQAADKGLFVVFDNIEQLALSPVDNWKKWDTPLTKIFMDCARDHKLPFAVVTNKSGVLPDKFRFEFSHGLQLGTLDETRAAAAFEYYFDRKAPAALAEIKNAYVGDFEKVAALMERIEHAEDDDALRLDMLRKQIEFRNHEGQGIGFTLDKKSTFESGPL